MSSSLVESLAATVLKALLEMRGDEVAIQDLSDLVLSLEQFMTTGGGWQDQVGGIYPGAKLTMTGPGPRQRVRVEPVQCPAEFAERFVLYYTGIRRIAKDLLSQVVGRYLAREVQAVQVLHSIKTLAVEMAYAMKESDWDYLGSLLDRHWQLNQVLDPHTTNAPINQLLEHVRPYISGAKLAGAGGGGFLMLLAKTPDDAKRLRGSLAALPGPGALYEWAVAPLGLHGSARAGAALTDQSTCGVNRDGCGRVPAIADPGAGTRVLAYSFEIASRGLARSLRSGYAIEWSIPPRAGPAWSEGLPTSCVWWQVRGWHAVGPSRRR